MCDQPDNKRSTLERASVNSLGTTMKKGGRYNWKNQPERLIYIGRNWSGNGFWHQFEKVGEPGVVWCEVLDSDLPMLEETQILADGGGLGDGASGAARLPSLEGGKR